MPVSPKDIKPLTASGSGNDTVSSEGENQDDVKPSPPTVFTFTNAPLASSKWKKTSIQKKNYSKSSVAKCN